MSDTVSTKVFMAVSLFNDPYDKVTDAAPNATVGIIPGECSNEMMRRYSEIDGITIIAHGYHGTNYECGIWDEAETKAKLKELEDGPWEKRIFADATNDDFEAAVKESGWELYRPEDLGESS